MSSRQRRWLYDSIPSAWLFRIQISNPSKSRIVFLFRFTSKMANRTCILNPAYHSGIGSVQIDCALSGLHSVNIVKKSRVPPIGCEISNTEYGRGQINTPNICLFIRWNEVERIFLLNEYSKTCTVRYTVCSGCLNYTVRHDANSSILRTIMLHTRTSYPVDVTNITCGK